MSESRFDFLKDLVKALPESSAADGDEVGTPPVNVSSALSNNPGGATESRRYDIKIK